jgi:hypothetical protein
MKKSCFIFFISMIVAACSAKTFAPAGEHLQAMQQKVPGITLENAREGYKLYSEKCASCHQLYHPDKYTIAQWNNILPKMFPKARVISKEQQDLISDYLHALSK